MKAGYILMQDMIPTRNQEPTRINNIQRVMYFEFLSAIEVKTKNIYVEDLIRRRTKQIF